MPTRPDLRTSRRWLQGLSGPGGCESSSGHQRAPPVQAEWGSLCRNLRSSRARVIWTLVLRAPGPTGRGPVQIGCAGRAPPKATPRTHCSRSDVDAVSLSVLPAPQQRPTICVSRVDAGRTSAGRRARRLAGADAPCVRWTTVWLAKLSEARLVSTCSSGCLCLGHGVLQKEDSHVVTEGAVRHVGSGPREQRVQGLLQVACGEHGGDAQEG